MIKSENARLNGWVYVDVRDRDLASTVNDLRTRIQENVVLPNGISISFAGQFEFMERANSRLLWLVPAALAIIFLLLFLTFNRVDEALLIMLSVPFSLTGGFWLLYLIGYNFSIASGVGFIALAGVSAEFGVIMLLYLKQAMQKHLIDNTYNESELIVAIEDGAVQRIRPKIMTVSVIVAGLLPIIWGNGTGSEIMSRIAVPMIGGMISAPLLSLFVLPAAYFLLRKPKKIGS
jgi:Cu(I)/Ag(I) efflux system membrane protein CusA/SilA